MVRQFVIGSFLLFGFVAKAQNQANTNIEHSSQTSLSVNELVNQWSLTVDEAQQYSQYMQHTGRFYYSHLDPLMVLGIMSTSDGERREYAKKYLEREKQRFNQEKLFVKAVESEGRRQRSKMVDFSQLGLKKLNYKSLLAKAQQPTTQSVKRSRHKALALGQIEFDSNAIESIDLLISETCEKSCIKSYKSVLNTPDNVIVNVYLKSKNSDFLNNLVSIKNKLKLNPGKIISFKSYDSILWSNHRQTDLPIAVHRRDGLTQSQVKL